MSSLAMTMNRILTPGRPSGVSPPSSSRSIPASHLHPITEVANPVSLSADARAQRSLRAVMMILATRMVKASAKVSSMKTPRTFMARPSCDRYRIAGQVLHRIVGEGDRGIGLEVPPHMGQDGLVVARRYPEAPAARSPAELPLLDDQHAL